MKTIAAISLRDIGRIADAFVLACIGVWALWFYSRRPAQKANGDRTDESVESEKMKRRLGMSFGVVMVLMAAYRFAEHLF